MSAWNRLVVWTETDVTWMPASRPAEGAPKTFERFPLLGDQPTFIIRVDHWIADASRADCFSEKRSPEERIPDRKNLSEVAVMKLRAVWVDLHVV